MFSKQEAKNLTDKIMSFTKLPECRVNMFASENVFIRFANNGITTSGYSLEQSISISSTTEDKRSGSATVSEWADDALRKGVEQAENLAKISRPNPEDMPSLGAQKYPELANFDAPTGNSRGDALIGHVKAIIDGSRAHSLTAAGFVQRSANWVAVANKAGLFGYHQFTDSTLSNTVRNATWKQLWLGDSGLDFDQGSERPGCRACCRRKMRPRCGQAAAGCGQVYGDSRAGCGERSNWLPWLRIRSSRRGTGPDIPQQERWKGWRNSAR